MFIKKIRYQPEQLEAQDRYRIFANSIALKTNSSVENRTEIHEYQYPCVDSTSCKPIVIHLDPGIYVVELIGAGGGDAYRENENGLKLGGRGGYTRGSLKISYRTKVYLYIGGRGITQTVNNSFVSGGFNGGGRGTTGKFGYPVGSGGGATDIRVGCKALTCRKMIAGGAGGAGTSPHINNEDLLFGGSGGGINGTDGVGWFNIEDGYRGTGASQNGPGIGGYDGYSRKVGDGELGKGGENQNPSSFEASCGGGGGGLYGGGAGAAAGGGGGSGFLDKDLPLINGIENVLVDGNTQIKDLYGNTFSGNKGNGMIRITVLLRTHHRGTQCKMNIYSNPFLFTFVLVMISS